MRVAVVAEWYPSPVDPVHGIWAHRQALAAREAGAEVRILAARRPIPPLSAIRGGPLATAAWLRGTRALVAPFELDGLTVTPVPWASPPRPLSYGAWGHWLAPPLGRALSRLHRTWPFDVVHAHNVTPPGYAVARWVAAPMSSSPTAAGRPRAARPSRASRCQARWCISGLTCPLSPPSACHEPPS